MNKTGKLNGTLDVGDMFTPQSFLDQRDAALDEFFVTNQFLSESMLKQRRFADPIAYLKSREDGVFLKQ